MKNLTKSAMIVCLIALGSALAPRMNADDWDKLTKVTFSGPVEIPGHVLLAGTYVFKLLDSQSDRNIVQVYNADQTKQIAMILAIPDYRLKPTSKPVITFEERAANAPEAVKAFFYPGDNYGQEFVYPKVRAVQLAKVVKQPVPSTPANVAVTTKAEATTLKKAPVKAQQPTGEEVEIAEVFTTPPQLLAQNTPPAQANSPAPAQSTPKLPTTASELPLVALLGFLLAGAGFLVRFAAKRLN